MGTRNLTMVRKNKVLKIAQYGQWDGYPDGQGETVLTFILNNDMNKFSDIIDKTKFLTQEDINELQKKVDNNEGVFPISCSRDTGAKILQMVYDNPETHLIDESDFINDDLYCEYVYELDLDSKELICYESGKNEFARYKFDKLKPNTMKKLQNKIDKDNE